MTNAPSSFQDRLQDKAIIVLGAATGIGAETVRRLAAEGARVCAADINLAGVTDLCKELQATGRDVFPVEVDIADETAVNAAVAHAVENLGGLDGAHINAADLRILWEDSDALSLDMAVFDRTIAVNLRGHLLCTRAVLPHLLDRGQGAVVYTSSGAGQAGEPVRPSYAMAKSGLNALMRHVASRWGSQGISANCIAPGVVITPEMDNSGLMPDDFQATMLANTPHQRLGVTQDIAAMVAHLLSSDGRWINGQVLGVNGGALM